MRRSMPTVSRTNQCSPMRVRAPRRPRSTCAAIALGAQQPRAELRARWCAACRIASSSSRAIASGHHAAPAASMPAQVRRLRALGGAAHRERRDAARAVDRDVDVRVAIARRRRSLRASGVSATPRVRAGGRSRRERAARAPARRRRNCAGLASVVDEPPVLGALAAHAFGRRAEHIGEVVAHVALVGEARQAAGARQHAEQRDLGQRHRRRAIVDQQDLVAGERELVAAAGAGAVDRGERT